MNKIIEMIWCLKYLYFNKNLENIAIKDISILNVIKSLTKNRLIVYDVDSSKKILLVIILAKCKFWLNPKIKQRKK